ncbi:hypothetical protein BH09DEP1_BH09DEP1_8140 [soil metagenome]
MKFSYLLLATFSVSSLISMDNPRDVRGKAAARGHAANGLAEKTKRLSSASEDFLANATRVREQAEAEAGKSESLIEGIFGDAKELPGMFADLFSSNKSNDKEKANSAPRPAPAPVPVAEKQKPAARSKPAEASAEVEVNGLIQELNRRFEAWKNDPQDSNKRISMMEMQAQLVKKQMDVAWVGRGLQINNCLRDFDRKRDAVEKENGQKMTPEAAFENRLMRLSEDIDRVLDQSLDDERLESEEKKPKYSNDAISNAQTNLSHQRLERAIQYNSYAQMGVLATLGFAGLAAWKGSKEAAGAAVVCASAGLWCAGKKYQLANLPAPTQAEAIAFLEQQNK